MTHAGDTLKFRNGDRLQGALLSATATGLRWQADGAPAPILFEATNLAELQLAPRPPTNARQLHGWLVELTNGDQLTGDIVALDDQTLTLTTWYAGQLRLQRTMIKRLECRALAPVVIYSGPTGPSDWKSSSAGWTYKQGKLYSRRGQSGVISKEVGLPAVANIEFDIAWRGQPYWAVGFYNAAGLNGYQLSCNGNYLYLNRNNQRNLEGNVQIAERGQRTKAHVTLRVNKPKKTIAVYFDNVLVKQWTDTTEFDGKGTALSFQSQGQADLRLANIVVSEWDGKLDSDPAPTRAPSEDLVRLSNGDKVSGALRSMTGREAGLTNSFAAVKIPLTKIAAIDFAGSTAATARRQATDVRAYFPDGTQFTLALEQLDEKAFAGTTENCGRVNLPIDTFTRLRFNVSDKSAASPEEDDWGAPLTTPRKHQ
ncbi:MAG: hypothetical protein WCS70_08570 [Verrucomicrobiota bacterium]